MRASDRRRVVIAALGAVTVAFGVAAPATLASSSQVSVFEADIQLHSSPVPTLKTLRLLGVGVLRVSVFWAHIAPDSLSHKRPKHFDATNPGAYPAGQTWMYSLGRFFTIGVRGNL